MMRPLLVVSFTVGQGMGFPLPVVNLSTVP